jgi:hypothetical protein
VRDQRPRIHIEQGDRQVASALVEFTAYQPGRMASAERRRAESALRALAGVLTMGVAA